jgi:hypothetical protein
MAAKKKTLTDKQYAEYLSMLSNRQYNAIQKRKSTTTAKKTVSRKTVSKQAPLPESCHYSKSAAGKAADVLREKKIKSRVVSSGKFFCVYTVGKCRKGTLVGTGRGR